MGFAKQRQIELEGRGFGEVPDKYVCSSCFANQGIKNFIKSNAAENVCFYCGRRNESNPIAASLESVVDLIVKSVRRLYDDPNNCLPWDNEDKCYAGAITCDLVDVLWDMGLDLTVANDDIADSLYLDLTNYIDCKLWTEIETFSKSEAYQAGWSRFVKQVTHNSRYVFSLIKYKPEPYEDQDTPLPSQLLPLILKLVNNSQLRTVIRKGEYFYRARVVFNDEVVNDCVADLGPPKNEKATSSNRMSPAGIPMFYGSLDSTTALQEMRAIKYTISDRKKISSVKIAKFELLRSITVVDFSKRHEYCLFDETLDTVELNIKTFLNHFVREISKPIEKDNREHIEYVPTQIVAEYLKYKCLSIGAKRKRIKGIFYPSSRCAGISCALFFRNAQCIDKAVNKPKAFLKLDSVETVNWE